MKKFLTIFILALFTILKASAEPIISAEHGAIYVQKANFSELEQLFAKHNFTEFGKRDLSIPRIYVKTLPTDWNNIKKGDEKNKLFIRILLPLIMKINEEIQPERSAVLKLLQKAENNKVLSEKDRDYIEKKAIKYDVFTRNKDSNRYKILLRELAEKVDGLPPAFLIAAAGVYSDWGNSRLATQANSLYREEIWYSDEGIKPKGVRNSEFSYRKFDSLEDCLRSYIHKINTSLTYRFIRTARAQSRAIGREVLGQQIIAAMSYEGTLKNITGMLDFNLSYYKLNKTDINPILVEVK